jgi:hypothetical protein
MTAYRHHHAANPAVIFVLPEAGSPKEGRRGKPGPYPNQPREHWTGPPKRRGKAEVLRRLIEAMRRNEEAAREMMRPNAAGFAAWLNRAA